MYVLLYFSQSIIRIPNNANTKPIALIEPHLPAGKDQDPTNDAAQERVYRYINLVLTRYKPLDEIKFVLTVFIVFLIKVPDYLKASMESFHYHHIKSKHERIATYK